jgi:hypothetical protein
MTLRLRACNAVQVGLTADARERGEDGVCEGKCEPWLKRAVQAGRRPIRAVQKPS